MKLNPKGPESWQKQGEGMEHLVNRGRDGNTSHHPTNRGKSVAVENSRHYKKTSVEKHPRRHSSPLQR